MPAAISGASGVINIPPSANVPMIITSAMLDRGAGLHVWPRILAVAAQYCGAEGEIEQPQDNADNRQRIAVRIRPRGGTDVIGWSTNRHENRR